MHPSTADQRESLPLWGRRLAETSLTNDFTHIAKFSAPADCGPVQTKGTRMISTAADRDEPLILRWRRLAKLVSDYGFAPADGNTVLPQAAGVSTSTADRHKDLAIRRRRLTRLVVPQQTGDPSSRRAQAWYEPLSMVVNFSSGDGGGTIYDPETLFTQPQHSTDPSKRSPHVWWLPLATWANASSGGGNDPPFSPQQTALPSSRRPQVWVEPVLMDVNRSPSGGHSRP